MSATLAELIEAPQGTRFVIPWSWLTSNSKKSIEIVFQFAFDEEQDFLNRLRNFINTYKLAGDKN